ncbi:DUF4190 domain-containing protein [Lacibacter sp. H375]|uniref:DUF4190 domain-containing protein n=1 Tax=Lacibacter sp. H375 TaxID=3133424 RepID=UPI0030C455B2
MKPIITLLVFLCIVQKSEAKHSYSIVTAQATPILLPAKVSPLVISTLKSKPAFKKNKVLSFLLKLKKKDNEDTEKRQNRLLGKVSVAFGGLSLVFMILTFIFETGFTMVSWFALPIVGIILGMIALRRSKKFSDKTNSGRKEAIAGIILGSLGLAAFIVWTIVELSSWS